MTTSEQFFVEGFPEWQITCHRWESDNPDHVSEVWIEFRPTHNQRYYIPKTWTLSVKDQELSIESEAEYEGNFVRSIPFQVLFAAMAKINISISV